MILILLISLVAGKSPEISSRRFLDPSQRFSEGLLLAAGVQSAAASRQDSVGLIDINSPNYKYGGKAMLRSLILPGMGQIYAGNPKRALVFLGVETIAIASWNRYRRLGEDKTAAFEDSANAHWDFNRWWWDYGLYNNEYYTTTLPSEGKIVIGPAGGHSLEFFVDMDDDGRPEVFGNTNENTERLRQLMDSDSSQYLHVKRNQEYYENIGKYNQFFPGWDDALENINEVPEDRKSGLFAYSPNRSKYMKMREDANRLKSIASYSVSALMFNHVLSAVDAIFSTAKWNREHATRVSGQLLYDPAVATGVSGVRISIAW